MPTTDASPSDWLTNWTPNLDWDAPAGKALLRLLAALPQTEPLQITVFGSAPLQLALDRHFLSADIDIFSALDLREAIARADLQKGHAEIYIEQCDEIVFSAAASWRERAFVHRAGNISLAFPHPIDILVSKLKRPEPKDLNAFRLVIEHSGHPTPAELIEALRRNVDLFRPNFDEERGGNARENTRLLWRELYNVDIDVRQQIIAPALARRHTAYGTGIADHKSRLLTD
jgi:hypothetical protein